MSKMSKIMEKAIKHTKFKEQTSDANNADEFMKERSANEDEIYKLPKLIYHSEVNNKEMFGCQMVLFNENIDTENIIIYLHGGAYVGKIDNLHIIFCDKLANAVNLVNY